MVTLRCAAILLLVLVCIEKVYSADSYVLRGFGTPLVVQDRLVSLGPYWNELICLHKESGEILWRTVIPESPAISVDIASESQLAVWTQNKLFAVHLDTGKIAHQRQLYRQLGHLLLKLEPDGHAWLADSIFQGPIQSREMFADKVSWTWERPPSGVLIDGVLRGDYLFITVAPRSVSSTLVEAEVLSHKTICLRASDGTQVWDETYTLRRSDLDLQCEKPIVDVFDDRMLCATPYAVRVLDRKTARRLTRWDTPQERVRGVGEWSPDRIVVCTRDPRQSPLGDQRIRVVTLQLPSLNLVDQFELDLDVSSVVGVVGDRLIVSSLGLRWGVDLKKKKLAWGPHRIMGMTVENDQLYFSASESDAKGTSVYGIIGVCDPHSGSMRALHRGLIAGPGAGSQPASRERP